jgi:hypothetical protein
MMEDELYSRGNHMQKLQFKICLFVLTTIVLTGCTNPFPTSTKASSSIIATDTAPIDSTPITSATPTPTPTVVPNEKLILSKSVGPNRWEINEKNKKIFVDCIDDKGNRISTILPLQDEFKISDLSSDFFLPVFNQKGPSWLLIHSDMALDSQEKFLFVTKNKGETWDYVGEMPRTGYVNGITFRNENEGWAGFEYYGSYMVPLYRTLDGGKTWDKQIINLPKGYRYGNVFAPTFDPNFDLKGSIKIEYAREISDVNDTKDTFTYQTSNGGKSWVKENK